MTKNVRLLLLILLDSLVISIVVYLSYLLRFDFDILAEYRLTLPYVITSYLVITLVCFYYFKIYKRVWRYASVNDLLSIAKGAGLASCIFMIFHHLSMYPEVNVPRSIYPITALLTLFSIGTSRIVWRIMGDTYNKLQPHHQRALIIGAGNVGSMVAKELKRSKSEYYPVVFVDDDKNKRNLEVLGIQVAGDRQSIPSLVEQYKIDQIIIAMPSATRLEISNIIEICKKTNRRIKIIPRMNDLINGKITVNSIRDVSVEDLLGREPVKIDLDEIAGFLTDQVILVTGAGGSIGSELCRQISAFHPKQLLLLGKGENSIFEIEMELRKTFPYVPIDPIVADIQDRQRIMDIFSTYKPHVVFHAAAYKHVPMMERHPHEAIKNNALGTRNLAECAHLNHVNKFIMISTDKAVNPTSVMGTTKRIAEMIVQGFDQISHTSFAAVRFGNVLGSRGSVVPIFKKQIEEGGPVTVTHPDMVRYFMTIPEAVQLVIQSCALTEGGEIFVLDMGKPVKISDLAKDLIMLSGLEPNKDVKIEYTGIRPGEKLFEEILSGEEGTQATKHDRIYIGKAREVNYEHVVQMTESLERIESSLTSQDFRRILKMYVPEYNIPQYIADDEEQKINNEAFRASLELVASIETK
ncbi:polysaccharide biosynthesis protein [Paenibacillus koleovorans]|uniref:polysaccharide biosynthesis protein n=1 Tax=Paenibacillus koleovorans TaxID=121608 RepID=UPI000FDBA6D3|nr:nucleoside-diphosphate sugar epimerase/dehydratase [Paenibacillus koleovorans]